MRPPSTQILKHKPYLLWQYFRTSSAMLSFIRDSPENLHMAFSLVFLFNLFIFKRRHRCLLCCTSKRMLWVPIELQSLLSANRIRIRWKSAFQLKSAKILYNHRWDLGKVSKNQNGNLRWHLPWRGGGSRGGLECHLPILKNDFC